MRRKLEPFHVSAVAILNWAIDADEDNQVCKEKAIGVLDCLSGFNEVSGTKIPADHRAEVLTTVLDVAWAFEDEDITATAVTVMVVHRGKAEIEARINAEDLEDGEREFFEKFLELFDEKKEEIDFYSLFPPYLNIGSSGSAVKRLQELLLSLNEEDASDDYKAAIAELVADGEYGEKTANVVKLLQREFEIEEDGNFGPRTRECLRDNYNLDGVEDDDVNLIRAEDDDVTNWVGPDNTSGVWPERDEPTDGGCCGSCHH